MNTKWNAYKYCRLQSVLSLASPVPLYIYSIRVSQCKFHRSAKYINIQQTKIIIKSVLLQDYSSVVKCERCKMFRISSSSKFWPIYTRYLLCRSFIMSSTTIYYDLRDKALSFSVLIFYKYIPFLIFVYLLLSLTWCTQRNVTSCYCNCISRSPCW